MKDSRRIRNNGVALGVGVVGAAGTWLAIRTLNVLGDEHTTLVLVIITLAFAGLALVALLGLVGALMESVAATRLALVQARLDTAEAEDTPTDSNAS